MKTGWLAIGIILVAGWTSIAQADDYDVLRTKWHYRITGGASIDTADPDIRAKIVGITTIARSNWSAMEMKSGRSELWDEQRSCARPSGTSTSARMTADFARVRNMALAYSTRGSTLEGSPDLAAAILVALDWLYQNKYNATKPMTANWWDWEIGTPNILVDILVLMHDKVHANELDRYLRVIDHFIPDPTKVKYSEVREYEPATGANLADQARAVVIRGILGKSSVKIMNARGALRESFAYASSGDGFYVDGSFIQHKQIAYTGSYGVVLIADIVDLFALLNGTNWAMDDIDTRTVYERVNETFRPVVFRGALLDMTRGRAIGKSQTDHEAGRALIASLARMVKDDFSTGATAVRRSVKRWLMEDTSFINYYAGLTITDIRSLKEILDDARIQPDVESRQSRVFASMDRVVHTLPGFSVGLSMFSPRISAFEYAEVGNENPHGWFTGIGMLALYNADLTQFLNYWPTVDMKRLPGITTDGSGTGEPLAFHLYANSLNWTGGSSVDNLHTSAGMRFSMSGVTGSRLRGEKSWFMFGDQIVALGQGINTDDGRLVETIIENRKLNKAGDNTLTVNGAPTPAMVGWSGTVSATRWAHLAGSVPDSDIGYYFPGSDGVSLTALRESRSGAKRRGDCQDDESISANYLSLAIRHGINPTAAGYAYVILPNKTAVQTARYAANPTIVILENSARAQAVKDLALNLIGVNFWTNGTTTVDDENGIAFLSSDKESSATALINGSELHIGMSDPTRSNSGSMHIEIHRAATQLLSADPGINVIALSPTIKFIVNLNDANGRNFKANFKLKTDLKGSRSAPRLLKMARR